MPTRDQKIHGIIHLAASTSAADGAGMAQVPGSDQPVISGIQTTMIIGIAKEYKVDVSEAVIADLLLTFSSACAGRGVSQLMVGSSFSGSCTLLLILSP